jgi:hypothetical protein
MDSQGTAKDRPDPSRSARVLIAVAFVLLMGIEASCLAPSQSALRAIAAWAWIACSGLVLGSAAAWGVLPFLRRGFWSSPDAGWFAVAWIAPVALVLFDVGGYAYTQVNYESVRHVVNGLGLISGRRDAGLFSVGFLGYPARQYVLAALPSYFLGRGLFTLRIGFGGLYLLGYVSYLSAAWRYLDSRKAPRPMLLASLSGVLVALGSYPLLYARLFEQTIVPLSAMLLFLSGLLVFLVRPGPLAGLGFLWALGFMANAYTPALSAWVFGMALLAWLAVSGLREHRAVFICGLAYGLTALAVSAASQARAGMFPARLLTPGLAEGGAGDWALRLLQGFHATFGIEESLIPAPLTLGIIFILVHSLRSRDVRVPLLCLWAAATVALSLVLKGYSQRVPEFDVHRAMAILPPLSLAVVLYASRAGASFAGQHGAAFRGLILSAILFMLLSSAYLPLIRRVPRAYIPSETTDLEEATMLVVRGPSPHADTVYVAPPLFFRLGDNLAYFSPDTRVVLGVPPSGEHRKGSYVISYAGAEPFVAEDPYAQFTEHPVRFSHPRPYLRMDPE